MLGEDIGAQLGLFLALGFLTLAAYTGNPVYDALGSISIGVVLLVISIFIALRVRSLLVGRSADPEIQNLIDEIVAAQDGIEKAYNIITIQFGPDTMLAAKVKVTPGRDIEAAIADINALERTLKERIPKLAWCFVEPDIAD